MMAGFPLDEILRSLPNKIVGRCVAGFLAQADDKKDRNSPGSMAGAVAYVVE
jgi:hypothetical protein